MKAKCKLIQMQIDHILETIKEKNPLLMNYLQKNLDLTPKYL